MSEQRHGAVVVGASAGVGRALATELARTGHDLVITGRHADDLAPLAADLSLRFGVAVHGRVFDLTNADDIAPFVSDVGRTLDRVDAVLLPAGVSVADDADDGVTNADLTRQLVDTNFTGIAGVAGLFVAQFEQQGDGTVVMFSSIAATVPRRRNVAYAAAKAALESYAASLRHRLDGTDIAVQVYVLGYVDTNLSRGQDLALPVAEPATIAKRVVAQLGEGSFVAHAPSFWRPITGVLKRLPWAVYRRLKF